MINHITTTGPRTQPVCGLNPEKCIMFTVYDYLEEHSNTGPTGIFIYPYKQGGLAMAQRGIGIMRTDY